MLLSLLSQLFYYFLHLFQTTCFTHELLHHVRWTVFAGLHRHVNLFAILLNQHPKKRQRQIFQRKRVQAFMQTAHSVHSMACLNLVEWTYYRAQMISRLSYLISWRTATVFIIVWAIFQQNFLMFQDLLLLYVLCDGKAVFWGCILLVGQNNLKTLTWASD